MANWAEIVDRESFVELTARERAFALIDDRFGRELCGPFAGLESPWLLAQDVVPQADDGVVVVRGEIGGSRVVLIATEPAFLGGAVGEVSGAKMSAALKLAAISKGDVGSMPAILLLESGGVRLQEANLGLAAVAEICAAVLELRSIQPVIGIIAGRLGCFGGLSLVAGLCSHLIMTKDGRLGLNGPEVIEIEAGLAELDSKDRPLIWEMTGGLSRFETGMADSLVFDDVRVVRQAIQRALKLESPRITRSANLPLLRQMLERVDAKTLPSRDALLTLWKGLIP
jgi:malonate decarboxylase beta subunit